MLSNVRLVHIITSISHTVRLLHITANVITQTVPWYIMTAIYII